MMVAATTSLQSANRTGDYIRTTLPDMWSRVRQHQLRLWDSVPESSG